MKPDLQVASASSDAGQKRGGEDSQGDEASFWKLMPADTLMLKGVAICLMLWHHLFQGASDTGGWIWWWGRHGNICVAMFLFLSGYGMSAQYGQHFAHARFWPTACVCWMRRYWRLYWGYWPVFICSLGIGVFVFHRGLDEAYGMEGIRTWICLLFDSLAFGGYRSYNITWWFYRLIVLFYALYPFLQLATAKRWWAWGLAPLLLTGVFGWTGTFCNEWILNRWLFAFLTGMFMHEAMMRWNEFLSARRCWVWIGGLLAVLVGFCVRDKWGETLDGVLALALIITLLPLIRHSGPFRFIGVLLGRHSMNIFLLHTFICSYFGAVWIQSFGIPWARFGVLLSSSLVLSMAMEAGKAVLGVRRLAKNPPFAFWLEGKCR